MQAGNKILVLSSRPVPAIAPCQLRRRHHHVAASAHWIPCAPQLTARHICCFQQGPATAICENGDCVPVEDGSVLVRDDLDELLQALPYDIRGTLQHHPRRTELLEVVLDLGRRPEARFLGSPGGEHLRAAEVTHADLEAAQAEVGEFGSDNRAGITGTLHRISCLRNRKGVVVGMTCRVGRAVTGHTDMLRDLVESNHSVLLLGRPGVGKTTVIRELARVMADELRKRVVIVDTSNEIGGDGDVPHPAIGGARRMQVPQADKQHLVMIEAVENHMPQVVVVDEIGTEEEALACRTIAERGVQLIGTAHGRLLENLIKNPTLSDLVGGIQSVTLGDEEAAKRGTQKSILERVAPPTFPIVVEIRERALYVAHWTEDSVDAMLQGRQPNVQVRERDAATHLMSVKEARYDLTLGGGGGGGGDDTAAKEGGLARSSYDDDYDAALRMAHAPQAGSQPSNGSSNPSSAAAAAGGAAAPLLHSSDLLLREGQELLQMVTARRASVLSGAKLPGSSSRAPSLVGVGVGAGRGVRGAGGGSGGSRSSGGGGKTRSSKGR